MNSKLFVCMLSALFLVLVKEIRLCYSQNGRPIIGILNQDLPEYRKAKYPNYSSYLAASYVKYIEGAGARVVPIFINQNESYYADLFNSINGVLFPGGGASLLDSGFQRSGKFMFDLAMKANKNGDYFPVWGTCLGFELLATLYAGRNESILTKCEAHDIALPLTFVKGYDASRLYNKSGTKIRKYLSRLPLTANYHHYCLTPKDFNAISLYQKLDILSTNLDKNGLNFISSFESKKYPIYGVQFHPEKNLYEWDPKEKSLPHSVEASFIAQYFANFFVNEARKSKHTFPSVELERQNLIYNFPATYTGLNGSIFEQTYFF